MKQPRQHYLLVVNRAEGLNGQWVPALEMARRRLEVGLWGLYKNTPHKKEMAPGDEVIVYLAGLDLGSRAFVARARVARIVDDARHYAADGDALAGLPTSVLEIEDVEWLEKPVPIAAIKDRLTFVPKDTPNWGCVLQRGVKRIPAEDAATILDFASIGKPTFSQPRPPTSP